MHRELMILVCHDADGHFADGNRCAVRSILEQSDYLANIYPLDSTRQLITTGDGGQITLRASGLADNRAFHRIELYLVSSTWTPDLLRLVFDLMQRGGFGLMDDIDSAHLFVTQPQQVSYYPWLPQPPLLVRNTTDLEQALA